MSNNTIYFQSKRIAKDQMEKTLEQMTATPHMKNSVTQKISSMSVTYTLENFLGKSKPQIMTDENIATLTQAITHYSLMPSNIENKKFYDNIVFYVESKKALFIDDIPIVRNILNQINQMYLKQLIAVDKSMTNDVVLKQYYRQQLAKINGVLSQL